VVFVGYGLRDQYLFNILAANDNALALFGDGPHFLITADERAHLPGSVKLIRYRTDQHTDHRSALLCLEALNRPRTDIESLNYVRPASDARESAYFLSDLYPSGTSTTQQRLQLTKDDGTTAESYIGPDWSIDELPDSTSTAAYDLAVGLRVLTA